MKKESKPRPLLMALAVMSLMFIGLFFVGSMAWAPALWWLLTSDPTDWSPLIVFGMFALMLVGSGVFVYICERSDVYVRPGLAPGCR